MLSAQASELEQLLRDASSAASEARASHASATAAAVQRAEAVHSAELAQLSSQLEGWESKERIWRSERATLQTQQRTLQQQMERLNRQRNSSACRLRQLLLQRPRASTHARTPLARRAALPAKQSESACSCAISLRTLAAGEQRAAGASL